MIGSLGAVNTLDVGGFVPGKNIVDRRAATTLPAVLTRATLPTDHLPANSAVTGNEMGMVQA